MVLEVYYSVAYGLIYKRVKEGVKLSFSKKTDVFGNIILYSIEDDCITIYANSLLEANMNKEELADRLIDCIVNSLELGYYAPKLIIYKPERDDKNVTIEEEIEGKKLKSIT